MVTKDLYYHEVAYVRGLEKKNAELVAERDEARRERETMRAERLDECEGLRAQNAELVAALEGLVNRLDEIHDDPAYRSVWTISQMHIGPYRGPTYVDALDNARAALAAAGHKP
jgi:hypothetical protein